jgi:hypothetical protein
VPMMTVRETLAFCAAVSLPDTTSAQRSALVCRAQAVVGLGAVGGTLVRGVCAPQSRQPASCHARQGAEQAVCVLLLPVHSTGGRGAARRAQRARAVGWRVPAAVHCCQRAQHP